MLNANGERDLLAKGAGIMVVIMINACFNVCLCGHVVRIPCVSHCLPSQVVILGTMTLLFIIILWHMSAIQ